MLIKPLSEDPKASVFTDAVETAFSRRHMLRRSLGVAVPVVTTLASGPVSAGVCMSGSANGSMMTAATSRMPQTTTCIGKTPDYWKGENNWGVANVVRANADFNTTIGQFSPLNPDKKLSQLIDSSAAELIGYVIAVWLNARAGYTGSVFLGNIPPTSSTSEVARIWENIVVNMGAYKPSGAGTPWSVQQTKDWLALTWT